MTDSNTDSTEANKKPPVPADFNPELGHEPKLDPPPDPKDSPDTPQDRRPDTVATPEGDNEYAPDQPLQPAPEGLQKPPTIDSSKL